jgi:hypothetical protein
MNFTQYLLDFYGPNGIYPLDFTASQIRLATELYRSRLPKGQEFYGDTVDRENVRDIILESIAEPVTA